MPPRILIVDDEPAIVTGLTFRLRRAGYEVFSAGDGEAAIRTAIDEHPDLLLLDRQLPRRDGMEVLVTLKEHAPTKDIPIVLLSGCDSARHEALAAGAAAFVSKPYRGEALLSLIERLLSEQTAASR